MLKSQVQQGRVVMLKSQVQQKKVEMLKNQIQKKKVAMLKNQVQNLDLKSRFDDIVVTINFMIVKHAIESLIEALNQRVSYVFSVHQHE